MHNFFRATTLSLLAISLVLGACAPTTEEPAALETPVADILVGTWRAVLGSPGGDLPLTIEIWEYEGILEGAMINGPEQAPFSHVSREGTLASLETQWYDSGVQAEIAEDGMTMRGSWQRVSADNTISRLSFEATKDDESRFLPLHEVGIDEGEGGTIPSIAGVWEATFVDPDKTEPARGEFRQEGGMVLGTFLTPTGDYRYLEGTYESGVLRLSTFDGAHAFLFVARAQPDGALVGDFWSRDQYHATWTARSVAAESEILPDGWKEVGLKNDRGEFRFAFDDLDGNPVSIDDEQFEGKVLLVNIFGSWCPNCNDEAPLLAEWARTYRDQGLEVVGLAYEFTGDVERDRLQVGRFAERHGVDYTLLLAGISDKAAAAETLPDLTAVLAYPTSIFIGRDGKVRKVYSGFAGPGTGEHHDKLVAQLKAVIEELLAEEA
jgi:thiol-disulfide isomerase/thioredoxin